ncbi:hypothetical protein LB507_007825 [Fusarium sp. FIESC RH6]|nr:hypothetical protein LB507_007825 [Fusarium sp. FIESC RH6]
MNPCRVRLLDILPSHSRLWRSTRLPRMPLNMCVFHDNVGSQKSQCHGRVIEIIRDGLRPTMTYIDVMINHQDMNLKLLQALSSSPSRPAYADQLVQ